MIWTVIRSYIIPIVILFSSSQVLASYSNYWGQPMPLSIDSLKVIAKEHHVWAVKHYKESGMLDSVIVRAKSALAIRKEIYSKNPHEDLGKSYHNLGAFYKFKGNLKESKKYFKEAVNVYRGLKNDRVLGSLLELGKIYKQEGDYTSAEEYFKLVIDLAKKGENLKKTRAAVVDLASIFLDTRRDSMAIAFCERHSHYFDIQIGVDQDVFSKFYNNLASAYFHSDDFDKAILTYNKASLLDTTNYLTQSTIYTNLAVAYRHRNETDNSYKALKRGEFFAYKSKDIGRMAFNHMGLAKFYESNGEYMMSLRENQKATALLIPSFIPKSEYSLPDSSHLFYVKRKVDLLSNLTSKVQLLILMDRKKFKGEILELFKLGDRVIDIMRKEHFIDDTKLYWREKTFPFYEAAISFCENENAINEAFHFFEKSKSVLLLEGYSFNKAISKTPVGIQNRYKSLKLLIGNKEQSGQNLIEHQRDFEVFLDSLAYDFPRLFSGYQDLFLLSLDDFRNDQIKDSSNVIVQYFYGKENVYGLYVSIKETQLVDLGETVYFDSIVGGLREYFIHSANIDNGFNDYKNLSFELYNKILGPYIDERHKELVIIPDGPFAFLPFESMVTSSLESDKVLRYLIQDKVIRYSFSGTLMSKKKQVSPYLEDFDIVSFLPFSNNEMLGQINFSGVNESDFRLAKKRGLRIKFYKDKDANRKNLLAINQGVPIVHLSSHGFKFEDEEPEILLSNSSISLSDIYSASIPSDLVFLSACETNLGENNYGEGVQSMGRAFTFAGANSVISSLWNVIASPTSSIVEAFYENISLGYPKDHALHRAKLSYLADMNIPLFEKSPYYWSGLVYYGNSNKIVFPEEDKDTSRILNILLLCSAIVLLTLGFKYFNSDRN